MKSRSSINVLPLRRVCVARTGACPDGNRSAPISRVVDGIPRTGIGVAKIRANVNIVLEERQAPRHIGTKTRSHEAKNRNPRPLVFPFVPSAPLPYNLLMTREQLQEQCEIGQQQLMQTDYLA